MDTLFESTKDGKPKCPNFGGSGSEIKKYEEAVFLFNLQHKSSDRPGLVAAELLLNWSEDERKELCQIIGGIEKLDSEVKTPALVVKFAKQIAFGAKEEFNEMLLFFVKLMRLRLPSNSTYKKILHQLEEAIARFDSAMSSHEIVLTGRPWRPEGAPCLECGVHGKWWEHRAAMGNDRCSYDEVCSFIPETYFPPAIRSLFLLYKLRLPQEELIRILDKVPPYQYDRVTEMLKKKDTAVRMYKETNGPDGAAPVRKIDSFASDSDGGGHEKGYDSDMSEETMCLVNRIAEKKGPRFFKRSFTQYRKQNKDRFQRAGVKKPFAKPIRSVHQAVKDMGKACWECGSTEHLARACPIRKARSEANPGQNVNMVTVCRALVEEQYGPQEEATSSSSSSSVPAGAGSGGGAGEPALDNNHVDAAYDYFGEEDSGVASGVNAVGGADDDIPACEEAPVASDEQLLGEHISHLDDLLRAKLPSAAMTMETILEDRGCDVLPENGFNVQHYCLSAVVAEDDRDEVYDVRGVGGIRASEISLEEAVLDCGAAICVIGEQRLRRLIQKRKKRGVECPAILPSTRKMKYGNGVIGPRGPRCFDRPRPASPFFECLLCHLEDMNGVLRVGVREFIEGKYLGKGIVLPDEEIQPWCARLHKALGHAEKKVVVLLQQAQAAPNIIGAYKELCSTCDLCQKYKAAPRVHKAGVAASLGEQENQHWTTDVIFPDICGQTVEFIHTIDHFTKDSVVRYLPRMDSDCFVRHAVETTGYLHGAPSVEWRFDAGSNFVSQEARVELQSLTESCAILEGPVEDPTSQTYAERRGAWVKKLLKITGEDYFRTTNGRLPDWEDQEEKQ
eukprot:g19359.t1